MMRSTSDLCNVVLGHAQSKGMESEKELALLLKAFAYHSLYFMSSSSIDPKRALEARSLDDQTKKFIEVSFYLSRALMYLKQIERYGQSPLHLHFYNLLT